MSNTAHGILALAAFVIAAFFAGSETAIIASDRIRLRHLSAKGDKRARMVLRYLDNPQHFLSVVLVGTNLGVIGCTTTFTAIMVSYFGPSAVTAATAILVPALLVFQEILPKAVFLYYADRASLLSIHALNFSAILLYPVIKSFSAASNFLMRVMGVERVDRKVTMTMEELLFHLRDSREAGLISDDTMALASRAFRLADFTAKDVMVPLDRVVMVREGLTIEEYRAEFGRERFSRFPVYGKDRQDVVGFLSIRDLLKAGGRNVEPPSIEPRYVVTIDAPIVEMMMRMKNQGTHMAMVRDESGKLVGMTTLEDSLERLVGAIADEFH